MGNLHPDRIIYEAKLTQISLGRAAGKIWGPLGSHVVARNDSMFSTFDLAINSKARLAIDILQVTKK